MSEWRKMKLRSGTVLVPDSSDPIMSLVTEVKVRQRQCSHCELKTRAKELKKHRGTEHPKCQYCRTRFQNPNDHLSHQKETGHCFCSSCNQQFNSIADHIAHARIHARNKIHGEQYECCDCGRDFVCQHYLANHCCACDRVFRSSRGLEQHMLSSADHKTAARQLEAPPDPRLRFKCKKCTERFESEKSLKLHKRLKHKPARTITCPLKSECKKKFATPSALFSHLESSTCKSGITREKLNLLVVQHDQDHYITSADAEEVNSRLLFNQPVALNAGTQTSEATSYQVSKQNNTQDDIESIQGTTASSMDRDFELVSGGVSLPLSPLSTFSQGFELVDGGVALPHSDLETPASWSLIPSPTIQANDSIQKLELPEAFAKLALPTTPQLRCPICPPSLERTFSTNDALEKHLASAAHLPKIFHCPMAFTSHPEQTSRKHLEREEKRFATISALTQHLEAGSCRGGKRTFKKAIQYVEEQLLKLGLGEVKLLAGEK